MTCPLCGCRFDEAALSCRGSCVLAARCALVCCPNCGYQMVDESRSRLVGWLRRLLMPRAPALLPTPAGARLTTLDRMEPGQEATVVDVRSKDPVRLERLGSYGLVAGSMVRLEQRRPALVVRIGETELSIGVEVARQIVVRPR